MAAFSACEFFLGKKCEVTIVTQNAFLPYSRDKLLEYTTDKIKEKELYFANEDFYKSNQVQIIRDKQLNRIDERKKKVFLKDGPVLDYDQVFNFSLPKVNLPEIAGKHKKGVFLFSNLESAKEIKQRMAISDVACIIGTSQKIKTIAAHLLERKREVKIMTLEDPQIEAHDNLEWIHDENPLEFIGDGELQAIKLNSKKVIAVDIAIFFQDNLKTDEELKQEGLNKIQENVPTPQTDEASAGGQKQGVTCQTS